MESQIKECIKFGKYYNPASEHYKDKYPEGNCVIQCDKCGKSPLTSCIGYGSVDVCLTCAEKPSAPPQPVHPHSHFPWASNPWGHSSYTVNGQESDCTF